MLLEQTEKIKHAVPNTSQITIIFNCIECITALKCTYYVMVFFFFLRKVFNIISRRTLNVFLDSQLQTINCGCTAAFSELGVINWKK